MRTFLKYFLFLTVIISFGCHKKDDVPATEPISTSTTSSFSTINNPEMEPFVSHFSNQLKKTMNSYNLASMEFKEAIEKFLSNPDQMTLAEAKSKWKEIYAHFEQAILYESISSDKDSRHYIDSWPMMPGYIDSIEGFPNSGIVNDVTLEISKSNLRHQHGLTFSGEVSVGFHAIEFMLWGTSLNQNESSLEDDINSPDKKPLNNKQNVDKQNPQEIFLQRYQPVTEWDQDELDISQHSNNRRRKYLNTVTNLLTNDIEDSITRIKSQWQLNPGAGFALNTIYLQIGKIRSDLNSPDSRHFLETTFSQVLHNNLIQQSYIVINLLKTLPAPKDPNVNNGLNILPVFIAELETTLKELEKTPKENELLDKLDFTLSQMESLLFGILDDSEFQVTNNDKQ